MTIPLIVFGIPTLIAAVVLVGLLDPLIHPRPARSSTMTEEFFEYAVRTHRIGHHPHISEYGPHLADAEARRRYNAELYGEDRVTLLARRVWRTEWTASPTIPPVPPDPDGGLCDPMPRVRTFTDVHLPPPGPGAGSPTVP